MSSIAAGPPGAADGLSPDEQAKQIQNYMWQQQIAAHMFYAQQGAGAAAPEGDDSRKRKAPDDAASD